MLGEVGHPLRNGAARSGVVPAIKPDFASLRQMLKDWSPRQPLQTGRPFDVSEPLRDCLRFKPQKRRTAQGTNGHGSIAKLVAARKARQREIKQAAFILIDKRARFLMRAELLSVNVER